MKQKKNVWNEEKAQFSYAFILLIMIMSLIVLFFFILPLMQQWTAAWYKGLERAQATSLSYANSFEDANTRTEFVSAINAQETNLITSNQILSSMIGFSGIIIVLLVTLTLYLASKRNTEAGLIG